MPFGFLDGNRSKSALNDPQAQVQLPETQKLSGSGSGSASSVPNPSFSTDELVQQQPQAHFNQHPREGVYVAQSIAPYIDPRIQQRAGDFPSRSHSTRRHQHSVYSHQPPSGSSSSTDDLALNSRRHQRPVENQLAPVAVSEQKKSKSLFDRMRTSKHSESKTSPAAQQASYNNTAGLARRLSKRQEIPPVLRTNSQRDSLEKQNLDWQSQDSRSHLPSPQEGAEDDGGLDPYQQRGSDQLGSHSTGREEGRHQTVRPIQGDSEAQAYPSVDEQHHQLETQQQHSRLESGSQNNYHPQLQKYQSKLNISPTSLITGEKTRHQNLETVSQLSYDLQDPQEQRPVSVQSNGHSPTTYQSPREEHPSSTSSTPQGLRLLSQFNMAPPSGVSRRTGDSKSLLPGQGQPESRDGPPSNYSRGHFSNTQAPAPATNTLPAGSAQGPGYRGGPLQREYSSISAGGGEQGRSTPPPTTGDREISDGHKELMTKYKKVKSLYFEKTAQVEQLQNTLANQRLSQSRTSLDDSEYISRFQRLEGATTNLAFNIRKDWRTVPAWLSQSVNQDAMKIGKQEMTAVGRACVTRFLVEEIFNRTFHPGLEADLSTNLKAVEHNIRRFSPAINNVEESDALTAKVVQWRLATLDGLKDVLHSPESEVYKKQFSRMATTNLTASLVNYLQEPVPAGIEDSAHMIVELAVSIASNLPLESRDISISYPMPGDTIQPLTMKVEAQIPPLENPGAETADADSASTGSGEKEEREDKAEGRSRKEKTKSGMLSAMMGGPSGAKKSGIGASIAEASNDIKKLPAEDGAQKVRFAGFVAVEVKGRQVLVKAPVWAIN
ncbi:uncharacterized protein RAG0_08103 [Rhynchosporium agropyri]|uniref:S-adenosylmethionine-dependent methyltransferase-like protein n=1 Tax=Rhynchosporium agropyri TaxID=914238 RepID=A0A1E1KP21_9HELO|nr:uncharacterized protein RAG0_08103 [Rhynchosporium agropyri]